MTRSLGTKLMHKAAHKANNYEEDGKRMFEQGLPCPPNVTTKGKQHSKWRGWQRAAAAARSNK